MMLKLEVVDLSSTLLSPLFVNTMHSVHFYVINAM